MRLCARCSYRTNRRARQRNFRLPKPNIVVVGNIYIYRGCPINCFAPPCAKTILAAPRGQTMVLNIGDELVRTTVREQF